METETLRPVDKGADPGNIFKHWQDARALLIERLGEYCSFCEMHCDADLAMEHKLPKDYPKNQHLILAWINFLLACRNCNSTKGVKDIALLDLLWPDADNTFHALLYGPDALIRVNPALNSQEQQQAQALLELVGVHHTPNIDPKLSDRRWMNRQEAWRLAVDARNDLQKRDTTNLRKWIVNLAQAKGYWSIWMTVFANDPQMLSDLIHGFPGTAAACFNSDGQCLPSITR
jgi:5-methylcytosine-specific restriction endonuclease McrA